MGSVLLLTHVSVKSEISMECWHFWGGIGWRLLRILHGNFYPQEVIYEIGVINSRVKSWVRYEMELSSAQLLPASTSCKLSEAKAYGPEAAIDRVVEGLQGFTARNLRNMRAFYLAFPIWHALHAELRLLEKGQSARDQLPTEEKLSALRSELSWTTKDIGELEL